MLLKKLGKYEVIEWLGGGRFGDVFLAFDTLLEKHFALKISRMRKEEIVMLKDEAKLLASLNHPNIVRFYNIDIIENKFVLVMEYIKGRVLRDIIKEGGIDIGEVLHIAKQILDAIIYAHSVGVLHRDLKPENILITGEDIVKITDFGLARFVKSGSLSASTVGTPIYMAPESWTGRFDEKSDVWSMGVILYELLTGVPPFLDDNLDGLRKKIEKDMFLAPSILRSGIPDFIEDAIVKCLNINAKARPDAEELLQRLHKKNKGIKVESTIVLPEKEIFTITLNPTQLEAIDAVDGKILLLGQAGCGKTTTLTYAIMKLIERNIPLSKILICTFTNKAASDIKSRLQRCVTFSDYDLWLGTFHTICLRILRRDAERLDISEDFIIEEPKKIFPQIGFETGKHRANTILRSIEILKAKGIAPDEFTPHSDWEKFCLDAYKQYQNYSKEHNILDYDDLILYAIKLLREHSDLREFYQNLFEYIFVDELQDINLAQYRFILLICKNNIFFTGDEDQAIYGWRGAEKELIYRVAKDFKEIKIFHLNKSFRLPQTILEIANNLFQRETTVIPNLEMGDIFVYAAKSEEDEVDYIVNEIKGLVKEGFNLRDIAILYRMNYLSKIYAEKLAVAHIQQTLVSSGSFSESPEVKPIIDYLEILSQFEPGQMPRIKKEEFLARAGSSFKISKKNVERANKVFEYHWQNFSSLRPYNIIDEIVNLFKLKDGTIDELLNFAKQYRNFDLKKFMGELKLIQELDLVKWNKDAVKLMTVHSAKGLEFPVVFLVDLNEDIFPMTKSMSSQRDLEEERRLCYVAITRAQKRLYLLYSKWRYGRYQEPSRFLFDIFRRH